jgi:glycosyltransferase involved in cell wall biosynthesis
MAGPAVTVCIPTYNYGHYVGRAIDSVLGQSFSDLELIVSDDGSSDGTSELLKRYAQAQNVGMFENFNRCIEAANGRYIKFLMADDWLARESLARSVELLDRFPNAEIATTGGFLADNNDEVFALERQPLGDGPLVDRHDVAAAFALGINVVGMPSNAMMRTQSLREAGGFSAQYAPAGDVWLWLNLLCRGDLAWDPEPLCFLRIHDQHTHQWGGGPDESILKVWRDAAALPDSPIDQDTLERGLRNWCAVFSSYALRRRLDGDRATAQKLFAVTRSWRGPLRGSFELAATVPGRLADRAAVRKATREQRALIHGERLAVGPDIAELRERAKAADASV